MPSDTGTTVYTVTVTLETRDRDLAHELATRVTGDAQDDARRHPSLDWDVSTGRYDDGELKIPNLLVEEVASRVLGKLGPDAEVGEAIRPFALAQAAYAAYGQSTGSLNYQGLPMPGWEDLGDAIQRAWVLAADAAVGGYVRAVRARALRDAE
jgi:hypothetical protein